MQISPPIRLAFAIIAALTLSAAPTFSAEKSSPAPEEKKAIAKPKSAPKPEPKEKEAPKDTSKKTDPSVKEKPEEEKKSDKPAEPALHKVARGEFELKVELDGILQSVQQTPLSIAPNAWNDFTVVEVAAHGTEVKKGDVVLRFDPVKLKEEIADLKKQAPLAELNLSLARQELEALEKTTPVALANARRGKIEAEQDLAYFEDVTRALRERDAKENVRRIEQNLSYSQEELNQLKKMYEADDLTEETEEIILKRAQNEVAYYEWLLEQTRERSARTLNTTIPRELDSQRRNAENLSLAWRQAERGLPDALRKKRLEVESQERDARKAGERLADLENDLALLTVRAPHDGVVYYGANSRGKWITAATIDRKLVPGGKIAAHEVFLTVAKAAPLSIQVAVPEGKLRHLKPGLKGRACPAFDPEAEFETQLKSVSFVPYADHTHDAVFSVPGAAADPEGPPLFPGMTAKVRLDLYQTDEALTAPKKAVRKDAKGHHVHLKDGSRREVKVGKSNDDTYEILSGLKEGDEIKLP